MVMLAAAALVFLAIHLLISGTRMRDVITGAIGEGLYLGLFSLASVGVIGWLCVAYNMAQASGQNTLLYDLGPALKHLAIPAVTLAFLIGVPGLMMPNPTSVGQSGAAAKEGTVRGILRITRHPFLWGVAIWAGFHLAANGDLASVILFGTFFVLALSGTVSIDAKRRRKLGASWDAFAARTSNVPFAAIAAGRNQLKLGEYLDWRFFAALAIFLAVLFAHARIFGVSPFPSGWVPF
jgi:uncharacterized membrane protein